VGSVMRAFLGDVAAIVEPCHARLLCGVGASSFQAMCKR